MPLRSGYGMFQCLDGSLFPVQADLRLHSGCISSRINSNGPRFGASRNIECNPAVAPFKNKAALFLLIGIAVAGGIRPICKAKFRKFVACNAIGSSRGHNIADFFRTIFLFIGLSIRRIEIQPVQISLCGKIDRICPHLADGQRFL